MDSKLLMRENKNLYGKLYARTESILRYPSDWIVRFHNMFLKKNLPSGLIFDYGCGTGNNDIFFIEKGYEVYGVDVNEATIDFIRMNLKEKGLDMKLAKNFSVIDPDFKKLPFKDNYFDFILSNQVLYYLGSEERIKSVCKELSRILRPGGYVFFTVMGPKNYYIVYHAKQIHNNRVYEIVIDQQGHRLHGNRELIYLVRDEDDLKDLFSEFKCLTTGYFDQAMFDMKSNFHWIFVGKK